MLDATARATAHGWAAREWAARDSLDALDALGLKRRDGRTLQSLVHTADAAVLLPLHLQRVRRSV